MALPTLGPAQTILLAGGVLLACGAPLLAVAAAALIGLRGGRER